MEGDIFCSPDGKGSGTSEKDPASVTDAISKLTPGHTIYLLGGTYNFSEMILIDDKNNGTILLYVSCEFSCFRSEGWNRTSDNRSFAVPTTTMIGLVSLLYHG